MQCPECGAEVVPNAIYCHKCGERMDLMQEEFPYKGTDSAEADHEDAATEGDPYPAGAESTRSPKERFQQAVADRQTSKKQPEKELWRGRYCAKAMIGAWVLSGLITVAVPIVGIVISEGWFWWIAAIGLIALWIHQLLKYAYRRLNISYEFTTQRLIHHMGILRQVTDRIEAIDMDDITFEQTVLERLVGTGTIHIISSDRSHPEIFLKGIDNVKEVSEIIDDTRRKERRRRGLHIEQV